MTTAFTVEYLPLSWKRRLFAYYLDLLFVGAIVTPLAYRFGIVRFAWPVALLVVTVLELLVSAAGVRSLGDYALGIEREQWKRGLVNAELKKEAHWFILIIGFLQYYAAVRFFTDEIAKYDWYFFFGRRVVADEALILFILMGLLTAYSAVTVFRCKTFAPLLAIGLQVLTIANHVLSWPLARELSQAVIDRRVAEQPARKVPLGADDLNMLALAMSLLYLVMLVLGGWFLRSRFRFRGAF